ncbi:hypothetical protein RKE25_21605 [Dyella sp. BiH032]|uniref:hypothetical protein n=1 Tax=Dyella sp. BiH032 TaxID=3075430 RepID=UPI002892D65C|nr:hypothetical protein [Dyella sp. BiH032]WNL45973.1 hypothetical protein RKE25_21605 [Dyella sp. BiH032]
MSITTTTAFNLLPDGSIVMQGDHAPGVSGAKPFSELGVQSQRKNLGSYEIRGPSISLPDGWRATVYRDENDEPTLRIRLLPDADVLTVLTSDPASGEPKDIVHMLTLRVSIASA